MFVGIDVPRIALTCICARLSPSAETVPASQTWSSGWVRSPLLSWCSRRPAASRSPWAAGIAAAACRSPWSIRPRSAFARATGRLAKTDRLDAAVIAHSAEAVRPEPRPLASEAVQGLAELVARRRQVVEMIGMGTNRRRSARNPRGLKGIARTFKALEAALAAVDRRDR